MADPVRVVAPVRVARPVRRAVAATAIGAALLGSAVAVSGAVPGAPGAAAATTYPTPTCQEWQTVTLVPVTPRPTHTSTTRRSGIPQSSPTRPATVATPTAPLPSRPVCRNAPPVPFAAPAWDAESVVGGTDLAATGVIARPLPGGAAPPDVIDVSYVVADMTTGEVLAAKSPHAWLRPASTLKTLTALTLMPLLDPRKTVVASPQAQAAIGSRVGVLAGNPYPVGSLFEAMLMWSANDAAYALADAAGGYDRTVALMNAKAIEIGAHDTVTRDPSGLDGDGQRSSAYDLALIGRAAMGLPAFRTTIVKRDVVFPGGRDKSGKVWPAFHVGNINELLSRYPGTIGIKPGRTNRAQHTFIGAATRGGRTLIVTQMGSTTGTWEDTAALLDGGFANAAKVEPVGRLVAPGEAQPPRQAPTLTAATSLAPTTGESGASGAPGAPGPIAITATPTGTPTPPDTPPDTVAFGPVTADRASSVATWAVAGLSTLVLGGGVVLVRRGVRRARS